LALGIESTLIGEETLDDRVPTLADSEIAEALREKRQYDCYVLIAKV